MALFAPSLPQFGVQPRFRGIPMPSDLGMGMDPYKAAGLLRKAGKSIAKGAKSAMPGGRTKSKSTSRTAGKAGGKSVARGYGKSSGGKK
jgi:hypothetical protein